MMSLGGASEFSIDGQAIVEISGLENRRCVPTHTHEMKPKINCVS
jgi:hypothetical protein